MHVLLQSLRALQLWSQQPERERDSERERRGRRDGCDVPVVALPSSQMILWLSALDWLGNWVGFVVCRDVRLPLAA